ncbi:hypothetical protein Nepgr_017267 [Nepenthes gracilis]|uniref:Uncharacterized protein n=1 Tax=Nepenthes gracilis TaxID=150966 RepID=A0AAD3SS99_NEPGR|nr:hypothetical protein Nepgr_017267 [Nepenthes gracilis]
MTSKQDTGTKSHLIETKSLPRLLVRTLRVPQEIQSPLNLSRIRRRQCAPLEHGTEVFRFYNGKGEKGSRLKGKRWLG